MTHSKLFTVLACSALLAGCAANSTSTRGRTQVPPAPVATTSTSTDLIPEGTTIVIRANEAIDAEQAVQGRTYDAVVAQDIVNASGQILVPKGADAKLRVLDRSSGGIVGSSKLELALASISTGGRTYTVNTDVIQERGREGLGANERTARNVGGGAALGALIGAIAGGGSGAAAGAAIGAGAGAAAQVLTRGDAIRVPAETVLTFRLERPIRLT